MLADELGTGIHIHLNESLTEVENSKQRFGRRPTEVAYDCGILFDRCIAAHCVWLSDAEIALMRETGTQISHNPSSNAKLGNGIARVPEMLAAGINVGLGHDAAECNNSRDLFEVMKFASLIHRANRVDPSLQQAPDVVRMATRNGSAALGHETGELTAGKKADVILGRPAEPDVHAALSREQGAPVLAPGVRRQRQRREHHDHRRQGRLRGPAVHDDRRGPGAAGSERVVPGGSRADGRSHLTERTLILGDPVVALGRETLIPDGALIVEGSTIVAAGPRVELEQRGPFDRTLGSPEHFVMPGFVNCHYHSELAIGPGLYQFIFERANVFMQAGLGDIEEEDLYTGVLWGLVNAIKGGQTSTVDMYYGRPGMADFGCRPALRAYEDAGMRTAFGLVSRDENIYVHEPNERFLARLPAELAEEIRRSPMGYAWPVEDVMAAFERLYADWHGRDDRIRIVTAPDWTPACSDDLYRRVPARSPTSTAPG